MASTLELLLMAQTSGLPAELATLTTQLATILSEITEPAWLPLSLINGWSNTGGGKVAAQYRFLPLTNELEIVGVVSSASISGNSQPFSALSANFPASTLIDICHEAVLSSQPTVSISYSPSGIIEFIDLPSGSTRVAFHNFFPLDA